MKSLNAGILSAAALAARITCQGQVYSTDSTGHVPLSHQPDEICLWSEMSGTNFYAEWYVSTNTLARQPRWDAFSAEVPVSIHQACALALKQSAKEHPEVKLWALDSISLQNPHSSYDATWLSKVWFYSVTLKPLDAKFQEHFQGVNTTFPQFDSLQMVLLDGTIVPRRSEQGARIRQKMTD